jgi:hypothetical protein
MPHGRINMLGSFLGALRRHLRRIGRGWSNPRPKLFALNVVFRLFGLNLYRPLFVHDYHPSWRTALEFLAAHFFRAGFFHRQKLAGPVHSLTDQM